MFRKRPALVALLGAMTLGAAAHPGPRSDVAGTRAALTADHALAVLEGAEVLRRGGNAMDAAITMAAVLAVARPHMCGVGGDLFLLYRDGRTGAVHALNGSGRAPGAATPARYRERGLTEVPEHGPLSVSVPGAVRAWADALERHGTLTFAAALGPAIRYAKDGIAVSSRLAEDIAGERARLAREPALAAVYLPEGAPPQPGAVLRQADLARTLETLAAGGPDALYRGPLAQRIAAFVQERGGLMSTEDLAGHRSTWHEPIATTYLGLRVLAFPPSTQGVTLLQQMNMAALLDLRGAGHNTAGYVDTLVRIKRAAFADRDRYVADPEFAPVPVERLLSVEHARARALEAGLLSTPSAPPSAPPAREGSGDTVYLSVADQHGNAVSLIQSLFDSFGSGLMVPGTGIVLHNRGALFTLDEAHPNALAPHKRPYHTLCPAMAEHADGRLALVFGTPGGDGQTQTLLQVFHNLRLFGMSPQQAVEAPRFRSMKQGLAVETGFTHEVRQALAGMGHRLIDARPAEYGGAQAIVVDPASGSLRAGADPRREAAALAW